PPYYCLVSKQPIIVWSGILITMMGSSGPAAPRYNLIPAPPPNTPPTSPSLPGTPTIGRVVISEVFYGVDASHGIDPENEWIEIYNGSNTTVNISGWTITDASVARTIPSGYSLPPNTFAVLVGAQNTKNFWQIPSSVPVIYLGNYIGNGLGAAGDELFLRDASNNIVDSLSWGSDTRVFSPALPVYQDGHSLARKRLDADNHAVSDWFDLPTPTPGR
ncbi:MAG: hypothetical protein RIQ56_441, partial [Candidatus Parcubacteria bacterium]